ncbi:hypothetical protein OESDEN_18259 [Oesophagostomum dentatum]|uniref:Uncharacterized protein n=1 Tax=Oesophagostomum dentatum TaxID=61180 RepID=A0A0B1SFR5_OESDE|nr:hypothetical protein OESDEN_18259 [Oesophagostomum dentatum]
MTTAPTVGPEVDGEVYFEICISHYLEILLCLGHPKTETAYYNSIFCRRDFWKQVAFKVDKLEMAELRRIIESSKTPTTPEPENYLSNRVGFVLIS